MLRPPFGGSLRIIHTTAFTAFQHSVFKVKLQVNYGRPGGVRGRCKCSGWNAQHLGGLSCVCIKLSLACLTALCLSL